MPEQHPSATQRKKFDDFNKLPNKDEALHACRAVIKAAGLKESELGTHWGVTVCVSKDSHLRLNVGGRVLLDVLTNGTYAVFLIHRGRVPFRWDLWVSAFSGFPQVTDSMRFVADRPRDLESFVHAKGVAEKIAAHAQSTWRTLPKADWHNPLVTELLYP